MAKAARIDEVVFEPDGGITVKYTTGNAPLPLAPGGSGMHFADREELAERLRQLEDQMGDMNLALLQLAVAYKTDPAIASKFQTAARAKTASLDLTGSVTAISLG